MVDLETHAYNALMILSENRELSYNQWRLKTKANIDTMSKVRQLLLQENLINQKPYGKQGLVYSINHTMADHQKAFVDHILTPYSNLTNSFIKMAEIIQQQLTSHQRILNFSENDIKLAKEVWKKQKEVINIIIQSIEQERLINLLLRNPVLTSPYKTQINKIQKKFYDSLELYFKRVYELEPVLFLELWQIIFFKSSKATTKT